MKKSCVVIFGLSCFLIVCSGDLELSHAPVSTHQYPIIGGSPPDEDMHNAVVSLHEITRDDRVYVSPFCSGTLIATDVVLTAAHCVSDETARTFEVMSPTTLAIYVGTDPAMDLLEHLYFVTEVEVHSEYDEVNIFNDIALLRLSSPIEEPIDPVSPLPSSLGITSADIGVTVNFAGFGYTESDTCGVLLQVDGLIEGLGCSVSGCAIDGDADTQFSYTQSGTGHCFGDSGGPAFLYRGSKTYVAGITSYGDADCAEYGVSTRVDAYESFITSFITGTPVSKVSYRGNVKSNIFHRPECRYYNSTNCSAVFENREAAIDAGYRPCRVCTP